MSSTEGPGRQVWRKLGVLRLPSGEPLRRATLPTPLRLGESSLRLFYGALDSEMVSTVHSVDLDLGEPTIALAATSAPWLDIGCPGYFDDNGVVPSAALVHEGEVRLYYVGFQKQTKVPYTMLTGLAVSRDGGGTYQRLSTTPLLERSADEPFFRTAAWPLVLPGGWRMWYVGGGEWLRDGERTLPSYSLRTMTSADGLTWPAAGTPCLVPSGEEIGFGRPFCLTQESGYRLWYSIRSRGGYRLGYAESPDGERWRRLDENCDLGAAIAGFDDEMVAYPALVRQGDRLLMFYNGNGFGRAGIGVAMLVPE